MKLKTFFYVFLCSGPLFCGEQIKLSEYETFPIQEKSVELSVNDKKHIFTFEKDTIYVKKSLLRDRHEEGKKDKGDKFYIQVVKDDGYDVPYGSTMIEGEYFIPLKKDARLSLYIMLGTNITEIPRISQFFYIGKLMNQTLFKLSIPNIWINYKDSTFEPGKIIHFIVDIYKRIQRSEERSTYQKNMETIYDIFTHWILLVEAYFFKEDKRFRSLGFFSEEMQSDNDFCSLLLLNMKNALQLQCALKGIAMKQDAIKLLEHITSLDDLKGLVVYLRENKQFPQYVTKSFPGKVATLSIGNRTHEFKIMQDHINIATSLLGKTEEGKEAVLIKIYDVDGNQQIMNVRLSGVFLFSLYILLGPKYTQAVDFVREIAPYSDLLTYIFVFSQKITRPSSGQLPSIWNKEKKFHSGCDRRQLRELIHKLYRNKNHFQEEQYLQYRENLNTMCTILMVWVLFFESFRPECVSRGIAILNGFSAKSDPELEAWLLSEMKEALRLQCSLKGILVVDDGVDLIESIDSLEKFKAVVKNLRKKETFPVLEEKKIFQKRKRDRVLLSFGVIGLISLLGYIWYKHIRKK